jgi:hypothetical protein
LVRDFMREKGEARSANSGIEWRESSLELLFSDCVGEWGALYLWNWRVDPEWEGRSTDSSSDSGEIKTRRGGREPESGEVESVRGEYGPDCETKAGSGGVTRGECGAVGEVNLGGGGVRSTMSGLAALVKTMAGGGGVRSGASVLVLEGGLVVTRVEAARTEGCPGVSGVEAPEDKEEEEAAARVEGAEAGSEAGAEAKT